MHRSFASLSTINPHPSILRHILRHLERLIPHPVLWHFTKKPFARAILCPKRLLKSGWRIPGVSREHLQLSIHPRAKGCMERKIKNIFIPDTPKDLFCSGKLFLETRGDSISEKRSACTHVWVHSAIQKFEGKRFAGTLSENIESFYLFQLKFPRVLIRS